MSISEDYVRSYRYDCGPKLGISFSSRGTSARTTDTTGITLWDIASAFSPEDLKGKHMEDTKVQSAWAGMVADSTHAFYVKHLKRLGKNGILT